MNNTQTNMSENQEETQNHAKAIHDNLVTNLGYEVVGTESNEQEEATVE